MTEWVCMEGGVNRRSGLRMERCEWSGHAWRACMAGVHGEVCTAGEKTAGAWRGEGAGERFARAARTFSAAMACTISSAALPPSLRGSPTPGGGRFFFACEYLRGGAGLGSEGSRRSGRGESVGVASPTW